MALPPMTTEQISRACDELNHESPQQILRWAVNMFFPRLTLATAFGVEGCCLIHMLAEIEPRMHIFNLETGYQFAETLALREQIRLRDGIEVEYIRPEQTVEEYEVQQGGPLYLLQPDQCCRDRKLLPLRRALEGYQAWISSIRKDQSADRARAGVVQWDAKFGLVKINPLLSWTKKEVWKFALHHEVPYNPLHDAGYPSIGCWPCTQAVADGQDERAGRWAGTKKKECGLHVLEYEGGNGI